MSSHSISDRWARPETRVQVDRETYEGKEDFTVLMIEEDRIRLILDAKDEFHARHLAYQLTKMLSEHTNVVYTQCHNWSGPWC